MTDTLKDIAVIILNWNGEQLLKEFLPTVVDNSDSSISRIIVADNGSDDASLDFVASQYGGRVDILRFDKNYGFAEGYNRAIEHVGDYKYVVLLNSDVAVAKGWDRALFDYMEANPEAGACQPKLLSYKHPNYFEYAGASGGYLDRNGYPYCRGRIFFTCEEDSGQYDDIAEIFWATGACLMIKRSVYLSVGGLDKDFFAHMEEIDMCWRINLAGYKVVVVPQAVAYHLGGASLSAGTSQKTYLNFRNNLLMLHKNLPRRDYRWALIKRRLYDTMAWLRYIISFEFRNALAVLRAHRDYAKMKKNYASHPDKNLIKDNTNILVEYYIKRHRKFSQLK